jgi:hypothetical protein
MARRYVILSAEESENSYAISKLSKSLLAEPGL